MPDDPQSPAGDRDARRSGSQGPARPARKKRYLLLILLAVPACFVVLCCGGIPAYLAFGVKNTSDPVEILAALESMTDVDLPPELEPHTKSSQITGVESVEFRSVSGQSYLMMGTGSRFRLQHASTLREDYDRGRVAVQARGVWVGRRAGATRTGRSGHAGTGTHRGGPSARSFT